MIQKHTYTHTHTHTHIPNPKKSKGVSECVNKGYPGYLWTYGYWIMANFMWKMIMNK